MYLLLNSAITPLYTLSLHSDRIQIQEFISDTQHNSGSPVLIQHHNPDQADLIYPKYVFFLNWYFLTAHLTERTFSAMDTKSNEGDRFRQKATRPEPQRVSKNGVLFLLHKIAASIRLLKLLMISWKAVKESGYSGNSSSLFTGVLPQRYVHNFVYYYVHIIRFHDILSM